MPFHLSMTSEAEEQIKAIRNNASRRGLAKQLEQAFGYLSQDPRYPGLHSHLLQGGEKIFGMKIWTSYVQNKTPQAHRILWAYGSKKNEIVILAVIPHY